MPREHQRHRSRGWARIAVATMPDAAPKAVIHAILADFSVAKELRSGAKKTEIVKRQHHRDAVFAADTVDRRRNHDERVVHVHEIGVFADEEGAKIAMGVAGPHRAQHERGPADGGEFLDLVVAPAVGNHRVAHLFQKPPFLLEDDVFAAWLLIGVVNEDNFHGRVSSQMLLGKSPGGGYEAHIPSMLSCGS